MNHLHELVSRLPRKGRLALADYATVAAATAVLFDARIRKPHHGSVPAEASVHARVGALMLAPANAGVSLARIARQAGYQSDYLTRKLRRESGLGLRELRDALRLEAAVRALGSGSSVADAASRAGFTDPGYFARWFRRRTGKTPREYRSRP
jgi:AraC family L-rhamnose operon transcriptional activator RhaR